MDEYYEKSSLRPSGGVSRIRSSGSSGSPGGNAPRRPARIGIRPSGSPGGNAPRPRDYSLKPLNRNSSVMDAIGNTLTPEGDFDSSGLPPASRYGANNAMSISGRTGVRMDPHDLIKSQNEYDDESDYFMNDEDEKWVVMPTEDLFDDGSEDDKESEDEEKKSGWSGSPGGSAPRPRPSIPTNTQPRQQSPRSRLTIPPATLPQRGGSTKPSGGNSQKPRVAEKPRPQWLPPLRPTIQLGPKNTGPSVPPWLEKPNTTSPIPSILSAHDNYAHVDNGDFAYMDNYEKSAKQPLRDPKGGLTAAGRKYFKNKEGANLKPGVQGPANTPTKMRRKGSFLVRFFTNPSGPMVDEKGRPTRLALSAAAWGEPVPKNRQDAARLAEKGRNLLDRYRNHQEKQKGEKSYEAFVDSMKSLNVKKLARPSGGSAGDAADRVRRQDFMNWASGKNRQGGTDYPSSTGPLSIGEAGARQLAHQRGTDLMRLRWSNPYPRPGVRPQRGPGWSGPKPPGPSASGRPLPAGNSRGGIRAMPSMVYKSTDEEFYGTDFDKSMSRPGGGSPKPRKNFGSADSMERRKQGPNYTRNFGIPSSRSGVPKPYIAGNIDLSKRRPVDVGGGNRATVRSIGITDERTGYQVNIPTIGPNGEQWSNRQAADAYFSTGRHLGKYRGPNAISDSNAGAEHIHQTEARRIGEKSIDEDYFSTNDGKSMARPNGGRTLGRRPAGMVGSADSMERRINDAEYRRTGKGQGYDRLTTPGQVNRYRRQYGAPPIKPRPPVRPNIGAPRPIPPNRPSDNIRKINL